MNMLSKILYSLMFVIAASIYVLQKLTIALPLVVNNYLNDLLCMPLVFGALTFIVRKLKNEPQFILPFGFIFILSSYYAVFFEYYLPRTNTRYTSDWLDVALYFIGGMLFYFYQRIRCKKNAKTKAYQIIRRVD
ncbi:hypothetical protein [Flavobacterium sp. 14A]|uniref:hypothetical protein n=1 Tax=Flavobacterium sp. 14A TaxID=2735896 RepID=UPI00156E2515|nr:hypothetical protein [Flavobacterium sp. 14A]NRT13004.1 hypothetical protein [Flavobacterium sp. 14A]